MCEVKDLPRSWFSVSESPRVPRTAVYPALGEGQRDGWPRGQLLWSHSVHERSTGEQGKERKTAGGHPRLWSHLPLCSPALQDSQV